MRNVNIRPDTLYGPHRSKHTTKMFATMRTIANPYEYFRKALKTELEHGSVNADTDVTGDNLYLTAKIVAAHLLGVEHGARPLHWRKFPAYYDALWHSEKHLPMRYKKVT